MRADPGCGVDVPGICYSLSFAPKPDFTCLFPPQKEILAYVNKVAAEHGVHQHFKGCIEWISASWQEDTHLWLVKLKNLESGQQFSQECRVLISAVGGLTNPNTIEVPGIEDFTGQIMHTARWDHRVNLYDKHVVVVGNGGRSYHIKTLARDSHPWIASATQLILAIAGKPKRITQFMRVCISLLPTSRINCYKDVISNFGAPIQTPHHLVPGHNHTIPAVCRSIFRHLPWCLYMLRTAMFFYMELQFFTFLDTARGARRRRDLSESSRDYVESSAPGKYAPCSYYYTGYNC